MKNKDIIKRIIPMPRIIKVRKGVRYDTSRVKIEMPDTKAPQLRTASSILDRFADPGQIAPDFIITLRYMKKEIDKSTYKKLKNVKNREQSYSIKSVIEKGVYKAVEIAAFSDTGLLYGAITFAQAVIKNGQELYIPAVDVIDWPEISFRGQWGGNCGDDMAWSFQYKLNAIDNKVSVSTDKEGNPVIDHNQKLFDTAEELGVDVIAVIPHLEGLSKKGFLHNHKDVINVPSPERGARSDYFPGLCMNKKATGDMIYEWMKGLAEKESISKILIWLSEEPTPCYCEKCNGDEPYQLETKCLIDAYKKLKVEHPDIKFGIMLSQGSFKVTDKIVSMLPKDVSLTYYDGGRTYDSGKYPMILPVLKKYSSKGGSLGVYPQVTHSWRTVFPWTAPAFIKYRCDEFVRAGLHRVIGYAVPSNRYHEFNLMAFAEWLWNPKGRSVSNFSAVYAAMKGFPEAEYKKYISLLEKPAWQLAQSKLMLRLIYNYPLVQRGRVELQDHRYEMAELNEIKNLGKLIRSAKKALEIARLIDESDLVYEAKCVIAGLKAYRAISEFIKEIDKDSINTEKILKYFAELKKAAAIMRKSILKWAVSVTVPGTVQMHRVNDTAMILYRALDGLKRYLDKTNVKTDATAQTVFPLGEWDEGVFADSDESVLEFDITSYVKELNKGMYYISFDFIDGGSGTDISNIVIVERQPGGGEKVTACVNADYKRLSVWAPWCEYPIYIRQPGIASEYILKIVVSGMEKDAKTCRGLVGIRKI